jgi:hypothetical protein
MSKKYRFTLRNLFGAILVVCVYLAAWNFVEPQARTALVFVVVLCIATVGVLWLDDLRAKWPKPGDPTLDQPTAENPHSD